MKLRGILHGLRRPGGSNPREGSHCSVEREIAGSFSQMHSARSSAPATPARSETRTFKSVPSLPPSFYSPGIDAGESSCWNPSCFLQIHPPLINPFRLVACGQDLVTQFQNATDEESKEKIVANLANFAYDPFNYAFMRQLNVLELFLDCITEPNERLVEFGIGGICNSCVDPANASVIVQCGGIPLVIQCLSSPVRNTVTYALGALYYLCNPSTKKEIMNPDVVRIIREYAVAGAVNTSFSNMANAFLEKHVDS